MPGATGAAKPRLLFCSYHSYLDPSSGAALSTRDLLELLAAHGWGCAVLSGPEHKIGETMAQNSGPLSTPPALRNSALYSLC